MTPKDYFFKFFDNAILEYSEGIIAQTIDRFEGHIPIDTIRQVLSTNLPYSNDYSFNKAIESLMENSRYQISDPIYVGKVRNPMPNCYTINSDDIDGCLICYTTGMTENTNLFAQTVVSIFMGESLGVNQNVVTLYTSLLVLELKRRIHGWYGGQISSNKYVDIGLDFLKADNILNIATLASGYSTVMDTILIFHEYAHYVMRTFMKNTNPGVKALTIQTADLYTKLCRDISEMVVLPRNEIMADLMALLLITNGYDFELIEIISLLTAFIQLKKMSEADEYTNTHRLIVIHYFFKDSPTYQQYKDVIDYCEGLFLDIYEDACAESFNTETYQQSQLSVINDIYKVASLSEAKKIEIFNNYADFEIPLLKQSIEKANPNTNFSVFEDLC